MFLEQVGQFFHELSARGRGHLANLEPGKGRRLYHVWFNPPRTAFAFDKMARASRESWAFCNIFSSEREILALHFVHVLLLYRESAIMSEWQRGHSPTM